MVGEYKLEGMLSDSLQKLLNDFFIGIKDDIIEEMNDLNMHASGRTRDSFEIVVQDNYGYLIGLKSFQTIVKQRLTDGGKGRGPTTGGGSGELYTAILQWIDDKGIEPESGTKEGLARAITKKIHKYGTRIYRGEKDGVDLKSIKTRHLELFVLKAREEIKGAIIKNIKNATYITTKA